MTFANLPTGARNVFLALAEQRAAIRNRASRETKEAIRNGLNRLCDHVRPQDYITASDLFSACRALGRIAYACR